MNFSWALSLDPQGTNTMIKDAMNQQRFGDQSTVDEEDEFTLGEEETNELQDSEMSDS